MISVCDHLCIVNNERVRNGNLGNNIGTEFEVGINIEMYDNYGNIQKVWEDMRWMGRY